jgi:hypothetical protein
MPDDTLARRIAKRVLQATFPRQLAVFRSIFLRLDAAEQANRTLRADLEHLASRHDQLVDQVQFNVAFGWDYVAMTRRLAQLEDHVEALMAERERHARAG